MKRAGYIILVLVLGYFVWPYASVAQLGKAVREGDVTKLERKVEWDTVRTNLKEDLSDQVASNIEQSSNSDTLGGLLANVLAPTVSDGLVGAVVDTAVTAETVAEFGKRRNGDPETIEAKRGEMLKDPMKHLRWAFFTGINTFEVQLRPDRGEPTTDFDFELQGLNWKLVRVTPPENFSLNAG